MGIPKRVRSSLAQAAGEGLFLMLGTSNDSHPKLALPRL